MHQEVKFSADVHLGKLARYLRLLGMDTFYGNDTTKAALLRQAFTENRIVLTRNASIASNPLLQSLVLLSEDPKEQLLQVCQQYQLQNRLQPFSRCMKCNALLHPTDPAKVAATIPERTRSLFNEFWTCGGCGKVYWKGGHYERMLPLLEQVRRL